MGISYTFSWDTSEFEAKAKQAAAMAVARIADEAANEAKFDVNIWSTTLQKSLHSADLNYDGSGDFVAPLHLGNIGIAQIPDLQVDGSIDTSNFDEFGCEFGSWVPYAEDQDGITDYLQDAADSAIPHFAEYTAEEMENIS